MKKIASILFWILVAGLGAWAYVTLAVYRGEPINSVYVLVAAASTYALGYRFYSKWITAKVLALDDRRATPCEVHDDGKDFVKTSKWIVFGHHFAAISGPGPLVGPVLAAQFGYLPSTLWILIGVVLGGAVQDLVILFCSMRRNGKSLGQMVKEELNCTAGYIAMAAILGIMIILLAVLALVVVNALAESPWGVFTVAATIPIAMFMGGYLRYWRVGKVMEASVVGVVLLLLAVWGGQFVHDHAAWAQRLTFKAEPIAWTIILYGLAASVLPIWLLLAPRDYLSTFMKLGTIFALALGIFVVLPRLQMPAVSQFIDGSGPVVAGKLFPFCFITIACGAISGFHTLIASGTTPKIISRESYARPIGYGAMCLESLVAIMALIAACTLEPGVYFSINIKGPALETIARVNALGFPVNLAQMDQLATMIGEKTLFGRTGGASTLAVGMAQIFSSLFSSKGLGLWYHFAIMFEALFILTTLDAGTRVGRYLLQDLLGQVWRPLGETGNVLANWLASILIVSGWGAFLIQGVRDPLGGINSLWPLFGIANQLLAAIGLCLATTILLKMQLVPERAKPRLAVALVTLVPLCWLLAVTLTAGAQKIWHTDPRIGFLAEVRLMNQKLPALQQALTAAEQGGKEPAVRAARKALQTNRGNRFNKQLDAWVAGVFLVLVLTVVFMSVREWILLIARRKRALLHETDPVWLPDYAVVEEKPLHLFSLLALVVAMARELSGEAALDRAQDHATCCAQQEGACSPVRVNLLGEDDKTRDQAVYDEVTRRRFDGIRRCC